MPPARADAVARPEVCGRRAPRGAGGWRSRTSRSPWSGSASIRWTWTAPGGSPAAEPSAGADRATVRAGRRTRAAVADRDQRGGPAQARLDPVEVDTQPEDLGEPVEPAGDLPQAVVGLPGEVAGAQLGELGPAGEVGDALGVAHHHVRPGVDELADVLVGVGRRRGSSRKCPPGTGMPIGVGRGRGEVRREVGHPGGGLGLPVHDEQVPAARAPELGVAADLVGRHPAAGLGDVAQVGQVAVGEAAARRAGRTCTARRRSWWRRLGAARSQKHSSATERSVSTTEAPTDQVAGEHRQAVAVVQRQRGDRPVGRA